MLRLVPSITCLMLALVIAITSVQFAAARGHAPAVDTLEICTGTGPVHILVDANGVPTGGVMICPDYATAFFDNVWANGAEALWQAQWGAVFVPRLAVRVSVSMRHSAKARGPPFLV